MTANGATLKFEDLPTEEAWPAIVFDQKDLDGLDQQLKEDGFRLGHSGSTVERAGSRMRQLFGDVMRWI